MKSSEISTKSEMPAVLQSRIWPTGFSVSLIALTAIWFVSVHVFDVANEHDKDGITGAPVWDLGLLLLIPITSFVLAPLLIRARWVNREKLRVVDYCGLASGIAPFAYIGMLIVKSWIAIRSGR